MSTHTLFGGSFFAGFVPMKNQAGDFGPDFSPAPAALMALFAELAYLPSRSIAEQPALLPSSLAAEAPRHDVMLENANHFLDDLFGAGAVTAIISELLITLIGATPNHIIIAHRGTASLTDLIYRDMDARKSEHTFFGTPVALHNGFRKALEMTYGPIVDHVRRLLVRRQRLIYVAGHSLGGAVGLLNALEFKSGGFKDEMAACYSFGSPRLAGDSLRDLLRKPNEKSAQKVTHYRVVRADDLIPTLPPVVMGFRHAGIEKFLDSHGALQDKIPPSAESSTTVLIKTIATNFPSGMPDLFKQHKMQSYRRELLALAGKNVKFNWDP